MSVAPAQVVPRSRAMESAEGMVRRLEDAGAVDQVDIVGSLRRGRAHVNDIDLVVLPRPGLAWMMGIAALEEAGWIVQNKNPGPDTRQWKLAPRAEKVAWFSAELFVADPDNYGWIKLLRTGDATFTTLLVKMVKRWGLAFEDGRLKRDGVAIETPTEESLFDALGLPIIPPAKRTDRELLRVARGR